MNTQELHRYFIIASTREHRLGVCDCVTFTFDALRVGWNKDYRDKFGYFDRRSAVNRLRKAGGLKQALIDEFGEPVAPSKLQMGDVAYMETPRATLGLVMDGFIAVCGNRCIHRVTLESAICGWKP